MSRLVRVDEAWLDNYLTRWLKQHARLLGEQFFNLTVTEVVGTGPFQVLGRRTGEASTDGNSYQVLGAYLPAIGDVVECMWRDGDVAYCLGPKGFRGLAGFTAAGFLGIGNGSPLTALDVELAKAVAYATGTPSMGNVQAILRNPATDTAGMFVGLQLNIPNGANRVGFIGMVSRGLSNQKADLVLMGDDGQSRAEALRVTAEGHLVVSGAAPTLGALQAGVASQSVNGNDTHHRVSFTTTGAPPAGGVNVVIVNFGGAFVATPWPASAEDSNNINNTIGNIGINGSGTLTASTYDIMTHAPLGAAGTYAIYMSFLG